MVNKGKIERLQNIVTKEKATTPSPARSTNEPFVFTTNILNAVEDSDTWLPVAIDGALPHIQLKLGRPQSKWTNPFVTAYVDSSASTNIGHSNFWHSLILQFPNIMRDILIARNCNYSPIILSGVFKNDDTNSTATFLPVALRIVLPYNTDIGRELEFVIACGKHFSVNFILGNPFLKNPNPFSALK